MLLSRLKTFSIAATRLNFRQTAEELHISQPSVSQQLKRLEEEIGKKLYVKVGRGIDLTDEGRLFLREAKAIIEHVEQLKNTFSSRSLNRETESLRVGATYGPSAFLVPSALAAFKCGHPYVQVSLVTAPGSSLEKQVTQEEIHLAIVTRINPSADLTAESYGNVKLAIFAAADHPILRKKNFGLSDLANTPFIVRGIKGIATTTEGVLKQLRDLGATVNVAMRCDSPDGVKIAVRRKLGVGILYVDAIRFELRRGEFKVLKLADLNTEAKLYIVYRRGAILSTTVQDFLALLRKMPASAQSIALSSCTLSVLNLASQFV